MNCTVYELELDKVVIKKEYNAYHFLCPQHEPAHLSAQASAARPPPTCANKHMLVCSDLQAQAVHTVSVLEAVLSGQSSLPFHFRKCLPHLNTQTRLSFPNGPLYILTVGLPKPGSNHK